MPVELVKTSRSWLIQAALTVLVIYFYVLMEWLFFATKPSFMSDLGFFDKLWALLVTPVPVIAAALAALFLFWIPARLTRTRIFQIVCLALGLFIPASILASSFLLLIDNFTYTVFGFGVVSTLGFQGFAYVFLLLVLVVFWYKFLHDLKTRLLRSFLYRKLVFVTSALLVISVSIAFIEYSTSEHAAIEVGEDVIYLENMPNILLLASDGLNAERMSVYGYHRDTTPFIEELLSDALFCENCFTNASCSGASIASMFTGKLPTQTKLIYPPDILKGQDVYRHLPGILRKCGYRSFDMSARHYADPYDLNMQNSFDWANNREINKDYISEYSISFLGQEPSYFLQKMYDRIEDRIFHIIGIRRMKNIYAELVAPEKGRLVESSKHRKDTEVNSLFSFIDASPSPFFAHLHLLGTHGSKFFPGKRLYSKGKKQIKDWMTDFYDDAILDFDYEFYKIVSGLKERGILDNTLIVICTDHCQRFKVNARIPLIFFFPNGEHSGNIKANAQNLDIAPTILDYLGIDKPDWMGGLSLISSEAEPCRFIFTVDRIRGKVTVNGRGGLELDKSKTVPPFYSLGAVGVFCCHKFFMLKCDNSVLTISDVMGHTSPCDEDDIPDPEQIGRSIVDHLSENGYDISSIEIPLSIITAGDGAGNGKSE